MAEKKSSRTRELLELFWIFFKLGMFTIGGGMAMIPLIQNMMTEKYKWFTEDEIIDCIAVCQALPGVIAINIATFIGNKRQKKLGAFAATFGMVLPSYIIICLIVLILRNITDNHYVEGMFTGIKACAAGLIAVAAWKICRATIKGWVSGLIAAASAAAIVVLNVNAIFPIVIAGACGILVAAEQEKKTRQDAEKLSRKKDPPDDGGDGR